MKRFTLLLLIVALVLPGSYAMAQDPTATPTPAPLDPTPEPPPPVFAQCDLFLWLDSFMVKLESIQSITDVGNLLMYVGQSIMDCGEEWLNTIISSIMLLGMTQDFAPIPSIIEAVPADDGELTAEEAEDAIRAALSGNFELANQYFCEAEQFTPADLENLPADMELENLKCARNGDVMVCEIGLTVNGQPFAGSEEPANFLITDEKLCTELN